MTIKIKSRKSIDLILLFIAVFLIALGGLALMQRWRTTHNPEVSIPKEVITHTSERPDETPPPCDDSHQVAANEPRKIEIPSIGVSGCIHKVGIDQNKAVTAPTNIHLAGWYVNSALPGKNGLSLIDGHVQGRYSEGIFKHLVNVKPGERIRVQLGDLSWREFDAVDIKNYPLNEAANKMQQPLEEVGSQLTLITCGGDFDKQSQSYSERVIVRAKLLD